MDTPPRTLAHVRIPFAGARERFSSRNRGSQHEPVPRNRQVHGLFLERQYRTAVEDALGRRNRIPPELRFGEQGLYLDFTVVPDGSDALLGLENRRQQIELLSIHPSLPEASSTATVFVPAERADSILKKIHRYRTELSRGGKPKNEQLVTRISNVTRATVRSLWTGSLEFFPADGEVIWWEVWLRKDRVQLFDQAAERFALSVRPGRLAFPDRDVKLVRGTTEQLQLLMDAGDSIAELRRATDGPRTFLEMPGLEQAKWVLEIISRLQRPPADAPAVCVLDTGVNNGHPLLAPVLDDADRQAYMNAWGSHDHEGHGTAMAGLAAYGDLRDVLESQAAVELTHVLESVKVLPPTGGNDPDLYGAIVSAAIGLAEVVSPLRRRVACLAVSGSDQYHGRPSSWSSALDQICFGDEDRPRAIIVAAGNIRHDISKSTYISENDTAEVEDPGQAWNALTIGAYTAKDVITDPNRAHLNPIAPSGDLSPKSRTSVNWDRQWPVKPDVVFEGGNYASADDFAAGEGLNDLSLITTRHSHVPHSFTWSADTSAATALASHFFARLMSQYANLRPETIRALVVQSAQWSTEMLRHFPNLNAADKNVLIRRYGYGIPNFSRASWSALNDATLIIEDSIQPFVLENSRIRANEMNLHSIPWPREQLQELGEVGATLRVTLSYYIEPNPGERGWFPRHRYASHGLRFDVKRAAETVAEFRRRINAEARADNEEAAGGVARGAEEARWQIGKSLRDKGSLHSDYWTGTAVDLASRDAVAVYPVGGWWKESTANEAWSSLAPYSLVLTLAVPGVDVDIYNPIVNAIENSVQIEIES